MTYSNLHYLSSENEGQGRIYNFFRGLDRTFKPSYMFSDDGGLNWRTGNVFIDVPAAFRHRPYVKYASDNEDTIHFAAGLGVAFEDFQLDLGVDLSDRVDAAGLSVVYSF